jgi:hypothetical protein
MQNRDQQGRYDAAHVVTRTESANYPLGVPVYDADGEKLGTESDWQDKRNFLVVHKGRLFGHDTDIPHAASHYSEMHGVYLRMRKDELTRMNQTPLSERAAPILKCPPILVPDMGAAAVAAAASADHAMPAPNTIYTVRPADEATQDEVGLAVQAVHQGAGQATEFVREQTAPVIDMIRDQVKV